MGTGISPQNSSGSPTEHVALNGSIIPCERVHWSMASLSSSTSQLQPPVVVITARIGSPANSLQLNHAVVGAAVGIEVVGAAVGLELVGADVGLLVGPRVGPDDVGADVGLLVGTAVGEPVGLADGDDVGDVVGEPVGLADGDAVGDVVGDTVVVSKSARPPSQPLSSVPFRKRSSAALMVSMFRWQASSVWYCRNPSTVQLSRCSRGAPVTCARNPFSTWADSSH